MQHRAIRIILKALITIGIILAAVFLLGYVLPYVMSARTCTAGAAYQPEVTPQDTPPEGLAYTHIESDAYLTFPEWYIVWSAVEYAEFISAHEPSAFPFLTEIGQYWCSFRTLGQFTDTAGYPPSPGTNLMLYVIGVSYSIEYEIRFAYENTVGRVTEWTAGGATTDEDHYGTQVEYDYAQFLYDRPWFEFPFASKIAGVWQQPWWGTHMIRKWERKIVLTIEFSVKSAYGFVIEKATRATYTPEVIHLYATENRLDVARATNAGAVYVKKISPSSMVIELPQYGDFIGVIEKLSAAGASFTDIEGNHNIALSVIVDADKVPEIPNAHDILAMPIPTEPGKERIMYSVPMISFTAVVREIDRLHLPIEHIYDY